MKILLNRDYKDLLDQIMQGEKGTIRENREKNEIKRELDKLKEDYVVMQKIKDKEINRLQKKIESDSLIQLEDKKSIAELKEYKQKTDGQKGGYIKEINKLIAKLNAKDRVIEEYEKALHDSEQKNQNQLNTIKELTKKIEHKSIEYKNNGLSKQTKKAFKKGNK